MSGKGILKKLNGKNSTYISDATLLGSSTIRKRREKKKDETSIEAQLRKTGTENRAGDVRAQKAVEELAVATRQNYERETPRFARARALHTHQEVQTPQTGEKTRRQSLWQSTLTLLQNP
jgi:hypothetical protein